MEAEISCIVDQNIMDFILEIVRRNPKLSKWDLFAIFKWETMIEDKLVEEDGEIYLVDKDSNKKFARVDRDTWNVLFLE